MERREWGFFTPYQLIRCECERHLKRTTRFKSMDEFVTLEALAGRAYVKELIRSRHGDQCSRKSGSKGDGERGRGKGEIGGGGSKLCAASPALPHCNAISKYCCCPSVIGRISTGGCPACPRRITLGIMSKLSVKWHLGFMYIHTHTYIDTQTHRKKAAQGSLWT